MTRAEQRAVIFDEFNSAACECECEAGDCIADQAMADEIIRLRAILAALREPSQAVKNAVFETWLMAGTDPFSTGMFRAAVAAAEQEVAP